MSNFFKTLIDQGVSLVYIDDFLLLSNSKNYMFQFIEQLHILSTKTVLNSLLKNNFLSFFKLDFPDMKLVTIQLKPIHSKIAVNHKIPSSTGKVALF